MNKLFKCWYNEEPFEPWNCEYGCHPCLQNGWSEKVIDHVEKVWKFIKIFWGNTFLFFWRELVCKEKESLNILFILFLLCWNCKKKNAYSDFLGRRFWKKQEDINTYKLNNWTKSLSLVGFLGKKLPLGNPKKN